MGSPQGNWNHPYHKSPYSKPHYPSTEGGFIPLSFSSPNQKDEGCRQGSSRQSWNNFQKNRGYKQWDYNNRGGSSDSQSNTRKRYSGQNNDDEISSYIHPSMFEDPWKQLLEQNEEKKKFNKESFEESHEDDYIDESHDTEGNKILIK